ncbi:MAG: CBS domain-containing protein [Armatimonadota bacterium]|nr:CBS domain-containing protein [Armatimonadota bacterium]MDR5703652.1 CBS domain-containing protein [Armatimonadota bacterium]MDR7434628.1 CBS domain-containing protein [Armatimonadota bacterium]
MLVKEWMTTEVITVDSRTPLYDALRLMEKKRIRRLPVVDRGKLVGIVTWTDLMRAQPSPATSLAVWEIPYLLSKAQVADVMTRNPITISPDMPLEEAALLMREKKIGGLPVMEGERLVGIITESDIFDALIDVLGLRTPGARLVVTLETPQAVCGVLSAIESTGSAVHNLALYHQDGQVRLVLRVEKAKAKEVERVLHDQGFRIVYANHVEVRAAG